MDIITAVIWSFFLQYICIVGLKFCYKGWLKIIARHRVCGVIYWQHFILTLSATLFLAYMFVFHLIRIFKALVFHEVVEIGVFI